MTEAEKLVSFKIFLAFSSMVLLLYFRIILEVHFQTPPVCFNRYSNWGKVCEDLCKFNAAGFCRRTNPPVLVFIFSLHEASRACWHKGQIGKHFYSAVLDLSENYTDITPGEPADCEITCWSQACASKTGRGNDTCICRYRHRYLFMSGLAQQHHPMPEPHASAEKKGNQGRKV